MKILLKSKRQKISILKEIGNNDGRGEIRGCEKI